MEKAYLSSQGPSSASFKINLSKVKSLTVLRNREFSRSSYLSRLVSLADTPSYSLRQR